MRRNKKEKKIEAKVIKVLNDTDIVIDKVIRGTNIIRISNLKELLDDLEEHKKTQESKTFKLTIDNKTYEVAKKQEQNGVLFKDIKIPYGFRLIKATEIMKFWDNQEFRETLLKENNNELWFFIENLDTYKNEYVARFYANSSWAYLGCGWDSDSSNSELGVIFIREVKR